MLQHKPIQSPQITELITGKIGLVGWNTASGLGYLNRDLAQYYQIEKWLVPKHKQFPTIDKPVMVGEYTEIPLTIDQQFIKQWCVGLDWLLFAELPYLPKMDQHAKDNGLNIACIPMWEWTDKSYDWLPYVDVMLCPTKCAYEMFLNWKKTNGYDYNLYYIPWPVSDRFKYRQRTIVDKFLFINGTGGGPARYRNNTWTTYDRKGIDLVLTAARLVPNIPIIIYSQIPIEDDIPPNIELRATPDNNNDLYLDGDVLLYPSRYEGIGLQMLEAQAAGIPIITVNGPPMNECNPFVALPIVRTETVAACYYNFIASNELCPQQLAETMSRLWKTDVSVASELSRKFALERSWTKWSNQVNEILTLVNFSKI